MNLALSVLARPLREGGEGHEGGAWLHVVVPALVLVALIVAAVFVARMVLHRTTPASPVSPRLPAVDELDLRYARGDLDRADYLQRRADLLDRSASWTGGPTAPAADHPNPPAP
jgi:uncharacterized membrane protein